MRRQLSLFDCFGIGINGVIGSGIFILPAVMRRTAGGAAPLGWLLVGGLCCLVALCFAEAASRTDRSGGPYRYACDAFGPYVGFAIGWVTLVSTVLGYAAVALGFGQTASAMMGRSGQVGLEISLGCAVVLSLAVINIAGVRSGARTGDALSVIKIGSLLGFVAVGAAFIDWGHLAAPPQPDTAAGERPGLIGAAFAGLFAMTGFEYVPVPAGEAKDPRRTVPLAMVVSVLGAMLIYMAVQLVADGVNPGLAGSRSALVDSAGVFGGSIGRTLMGIAGLLSTFGFCAGSALVGPRYLESFAEDRFLPARLAHRPARLGTPVWAIAVLTVLVLVLLPLSVRLGQQQFEKLANIANVAVVVQYIATCLAVLVLRRRQEMPTPAGAFVIPFGPLIPIAALCGCGAFLSFVHRQELELACGAIAFGLVLGAFYRRGQRREAEIKGTLAL